MRVTAGFAGGFLTAIVLFLGALGGAFAKVLSAEDDFDADDDPADTMHPPTI